MDRLVYAPKVWIFIRTDEGVLDLSKYIISGSVTRRISAVSSASFKLRNPDMIFTAHDRHDGLFTPMDPVTIWLQRLQKRPVRVFTGFLDEAPYYELYPGPVDFTASCTLKKLLYTYFDPGLAYTYSFLGKYGWASDSQDKIFNQEAVKDGGGDGKNTDGGMGQLLFATLREIGGWKDENIKIEGLPPDITDRMSAKMKFINQASGDKEEGVNYLLEKLIGSGEYGSSGDTSDSDGGASPSGDKVPSDMTVKGVAATADQKSVAQGILDEASRLGASKNVMIACLMCATQESVMGSQMQTTGDDDTGIFQQGRNWISAADTVKPAPATKAFLTGAINGGGAPGWKDIHGSIKVVPGGFESAIKAVQISKGGYTPWEGESRKTVEGWMKKSDGDREETGDAAQGDTEATFKTVRASTSRQVTTDPGGAQTQRETKDEEEDDGGKIYTPVKGMPSSGWPGPQGSYGAPRDYGQHAGVDAPSALGVGWFAICDAEVASIQQGWANGQPAVVLKAKKKFEGYPHPLYMGYGSLQSVSVKVGDQLKGGDAIGKGGVHGSGPHLHFFLANSGSAGNGTMDPTAFLRAAARGKTPSGGPGDDASTDSGGATSDESSVDIGELMARAKATALSQQFQWASQEERIESAALRGNKSLMNDKPLMPFIQQMAEGSLRQFMSMPNGDFFAFYPDYFGETWHRPPYWMIDDIEVLSGNVRITDEAIVTHQYVIGDTQFMGDIALLNKLMTAGAVTILDAFANDKVSSVDEVSKKQEEREDEDKKKKDKDVVDPGMPMFSRVLETEEALAFLQRYGPRPAVEDMPMIRNPFFEFFVAYQKFMQAWARQFLTPFVFTFMPELYPGGKVGLPDHGLQMYIEEVTHTFDYESGFTTEAQFSAPAVMIGYRGENLPDQMGTALIETSSKRGADPADKTSRDVIDRPALAPGANGEQRPT